MRKPFNVRTFLIVLLAFSIAIGVCISSGLRSRGPFLTPYHILGEIYLVETVNISVLALPVLSLVAFIYLVSFTPRPRIACVAMVFLMLGIAHLFIWGTISELYAVAQILAPGEFCMAVAAIAEIAILRLRDHIVTAICLALLSVAYWHCALVLAIVVG